VLLDETLTLQKLNKVLMLSYSKKQIKMAYTVVTCHMGPHQLKVAGEDPQFR
jgi:hypothetical protein